MSSTRRSPKKKGKSKSLKATEEQTSSSLDKSDLFVHSTRRRRYQKEEPLTDGKTTELKSKDDSNLASRTKKVDSPALEQEINTRRTRNKANFEASSPTTRRKGYNIDEVSVLGSRRGESPTDYKELIKGDSPKKGQINVKSPDNVTKIDLDNLETRSKRSSTPKTAGTDRPTPRSRRTTRKTRKTVLQELEDDSYAFDKDNVKSTEEGGDMARARTPGFNDTPKYLYGLDETKGTSSGEEEICVDTDINNNSPNQPPVLKRFFERPQWDCKYICCTSFIVFIVIAVISALFQPSPPDVPVVQFSKLPVRDASAWENKNLRELQEKLEQISAQVSGLQHSMKDDAQKKFNDETMLSKQNLASYIEGLIQDKMEEALDIYSADKLGIPDYALESAGGQIHDHYHSPTYNTGASRQLLGFSLWYDGVPPRVILQPDNTPGSCWAFEGQEGYVVIELSQAIIPEMFTLEHIPSSLSTDQHGKIPSAPKDFSVWAWLDSEGQNRRLLGKYIYNDQGKPLQTFRVDEEKCNKDYKYIELRVTSNHGDPTHTCIYRFRVHGKPPPGPALLPPKQSSNNPIMS